jgi:cytochrome d ubiquinol oxidase subunit I
VHLAFDLMVGIGFALLGLAVWFFALLWRRGRVPEQRRLLQAVAVSGFLSFAAIEMGWVVTEIGRQPWIIYGVVRTAAAITPAPGLVVSFWISALIYVALTVACVILLLRLADATRAGGEADFADESGAYAGERA